MVALASAWALHGETCRAGNAASNVSSKWSAKYAKWTWKYAPRSACCLRLRRNSSRRRMYLSILDHWTTCLLIQCVLTRGLTAYNHNLDTSREHYPKVVIYDYAQTTSGLISCCVQVITTRTYDDRLDTISHVRDAGISVCSGGILGLGESDADRVGLIWEASKCAPCFRECSSISSYRMLVVCLNTPSRFP